MHYEELLLEFKKILKKSKLKFTEPREAILFTLYQTSKHVTSEELYNLVKENYPNMNIGIATVYRTLTLLEENSIVSSISLGLQGKKYELDNKGHHDHLICESCGKIVEFENETIEKLQEEVASEKGFVLTTHMVQLYGICGECKRK